jgi:hypothetical protein
MADLADIIAAALTNATHREAGDVDFGWQLHRPADDNKEHILLTCEPGDTWQTMPGQAVRTAVAQHLTRWSATLTTAGLGVTPWHRNNQIAALIVAANQATADQQAAIYGPRLTHLNP